jgi:uncharacterized protein (DUF849 family)
VLADSNAQLVGRLVNIAKSMQREPARVDEVIERLKLNRELIG